MNALAPRIQPPTLHDLAATLAIVSLVSLWVITSVLQVMR